VASSGLCEVILPESMMELPDGDPLCEDRPRGGSSLVKSAPSFVFPPLSIEEMTSPTTLAAPPALFGLLCGAELSVSTIPSPSGASELGKKIRSSPSSLLQSRPFQQYYRRARELRVRHYVVWNDGFLLDSLEASKLSVGPALFKATGGEFHAKKEDRDASKSGSI